MSVVDTSLATSHGALASVASAALDSENASTDVVVSGTIISVATQEAPENATSLDENPHTEGANFKSTVTPAASSGASSGASREELRGEAMQLQGHLSTILDSVTEIKKNCTRLKTENRFIQEYIETLLTKR